MRASHYAEDELGCVASLLGRLEVNPKSTLRVRDFRARGFPDVPEAKQDRRLPLLAVE
jgi:hypothetical protein